MKYLVRKTLRYCFLFAFVFMMCTHLSCAATAPVHVTIASGGLTVMVLSAGSVEFGSLTLNGDNQTINPTSVPTIRVVDATGSNAGWNVTFVATDFTSGPNIIPNANLFFNPAGGTVTQVSGQTIDGTNGPKEAGGGSQVLSSQVKVVTTNAGFGKGRYDYVPALTSLSLAVPATTLIGSYTSTLTITLSSGP